LRVGGALAITIEWLRAGAAETLAFIGTGKLASGAIRAIQATTPFRAIRVAARSRGSAERFCTALATDIPALSAAGSVAEACDGADVIVTLSGADEPLIRAQWCRPGTLLVSAGGHQECEPDAVLGADRLFVDDWTQCTMLGDIATLYRQGRIAPTDVTGTIADVVAGKIAGRTSDSERIVAIPQGLMVMDLALCAFAWRAAQAERAGLCVAWP
jgi:ornithine cyclodeaminase/alanine dehydrogenase-like protein (mu-crystallin family)